MLSSSASTAAPGPANTPVPPASALASSTAGPATAKPRAAAETHQDVLDPTQCVIARLESSIGATAQLLASIASRPRPDQMFALTTSIASTILPAQYDALAALQSTGHQPNGLPPPSTAAAAAAADLVEQRDATIQELEARVHELGVQLNDARAQVGDRDARIAQLDEQLGTAGQDANDLRTQLAAAAAQAQSAITQHDQMLADYDRILASTRSQLTAASAEAKTLRQRLAAAHTDASGLREQLASRDQQLRAANGANDGLTARLNTVQAELRTAQHRADSAEARAATGQGAADRKRPHDDGDKGHGEDARWHQPLEQAMLGRPEKQRRVGSPPPPPPPLVSEGNASSSSSSGSTQASARPPTHSYFQAPSCFGPIRSYRLPRPLALATSAQPPASKASSSSAFASSADSSSSLARPCAPAPSSSSSSSDSDSSSDESGDTTTDTESDPSSTSSPPNRRRSMRLSPTSDPLFPMHEPLSIPTTLLDRARDRPRYNRDEDEDDLGALQLVHSPGSRVLAHVLAPARTLDVPTRDKYAQAIRVQVQQAGVAGGTPLVRLYERMLAQPAGMQATHAWMSKQVVGKDGQWSKKTRRAAVDAAWLGPVFEVGLGLEEKDKGVRRQLEDQVKQLMCLHRPTVKWRREVLEMIEAARVVVCVGIECAGLEYPLKGSKVPEVKQRRYGVRERYALVVQEEDEEDEEGMVDEGKDA